MQLTIFTDGGSRGNPGPGASAFVVLDDNEVVLHEHSLFFPSITNNAAEYQAMISALQWAEDSWVENWAPTAVTIKSDSQLVVRQLTGEYKVKAAELIPYWETAYQLFVGLKQFVKHFNVIHIPREQNGHADRLCNNIMDAHNAKFVRNERKKV